MSYAPLSIQGDPIPMDSPEEHTSAYVTMPGRYRDTYSLDETGQDKSCCLTPKCLACLTLWLFNLACGISAYVLALVAQDHGLSGRIESAQRLGKHSRNVSYFGIVFGIVMAVLFGVYLYFVFNMTKPKTV